MRTHREAVRERVFHLPTLKRIAAEADLDWATSSAGPNHGSHESVGHPYQGASHKLHNGMWSILDDAQTDGRIPSDCLLIAVTGGWNSSIKNLQHAGHHVSHLWVLLVAWGEAAAGDKDKWVVQIDHELGTVPPRFDWYTYSRTNSLHPGDVFVGQPLQHNGAQLRWSSTLPGVIETSTGVAYQFSAADVGLLAEKGGWPAETDEKRWTLILGGAYDRYTDQEMTRANALAWLRRNGGQTHAFFATLLSTLGIKCDIATLEALGADAFRALEEDAQARN